MVDVTSTIECRYIIGMMFPFSSISFPNTSIGNQISRNTYPSISVISFSAFCIRLTISLNNCVSYIETDGSRICYR